MNSIPPCIDVSVGNYDEHIEECNGYFKVFLSWAHFDAIATDLGYVRLKKSEFVVGGICHCDDCETKRGLRALKSTEGECK